MDLICDKIIKQLQEDRKRDTVSVSLKLRAPVGRGSRFYVTDPTEVTERLHVVEFAPSFPCEGSDDAYTMTVCGAEFLPRRDVIKTFVTTWLRDLGASHGPDTSRLPCGFELTARIGKNTVYRTSTRFEYANEGRNKKAINRVVESLMQVKGLCANTAG